MENLLGKQVTVFVINWLAMTSAVRGTVIQHDQSIGLTAARIKVLLAKAPRKRKEFISVIPLERDVLVFEGDAPFKADTESNGTMHGNACLNFVGKIEDVTQYVETKNLNDKFDRHDCVMMVTPNGGFDSHFEPVFPESPSSSAPVNRYREVIDDKKAQAA